MVFSISRVICRSVGLSNLVVLSLFWILIPGCKEETVDHFPPEPVIQLTGVSSDTIRQYQDELIITITYQDGDGDLGFENPEEYALFVRDIRLENFDGFYVGPLAPPDANVPIEGQLHVEFPSLFLFGNGAVEQTRFEIKMIDRAGHESNLIETGLISITRN